MNDGVRGGRLWPALFLAACQSYVAVPVQPVTLVAVTQHQKVVVATKADVLLVVDDSLSMSGKQQRLSDALAQFTTSLDALQPHIDYQVAVVTTSVQERFGSCGPAGDAFAAAQCDSDWGAHGFACDANFACLRTFPTEAGKLHAAPGAPSVLHRTDYTAARFSQLLSQAVQVGVAGARQPQGMQAMKLALADTGSGFLRDGAKVVVAFFSDAEDCSDPEGRLSALVLDGQGNVLDRCAQEAAGDGPFAPALEPVSRYVSFLRALKNSDGSGKEIEVASIVSLADGSQDPGLCRNGTCDAQCDSGPARQACRADCAGTPTPAICEADCAAECHRFCGGQVPGRRYLELALAFSGIASNVCSDDASEPLGRLAAVIGIPKEVVLTAPPSAPDLLHVTVARAGRVIECIPGAGFTVVQTSEGPAVHFAGECSLLPDDVWDIRYLTDN